MIFGVTSPFQINSWSIDPNSYGVLVSCETERCELTLVFRPKVEGNKGNLSIGTVMKTVTSLMTTHFGRDLKGPEERILELDWALNVASDDDRAIVPIPFGDQIAAESWRLQFGDSGPTSILASDEILENT